MRDMERVFTIETPRRTLFGDGVFYYFKKNVVLRNETASRLHNIRRPRLTWTRSLGWKISKTDYNVFARFLNVLGYKRA